MLFKNIDEKTHIIVFVMFIFFTNPFNFSVLLVCIIKGAFIY